MHDVNAHSSEPALDLQNSGMQVIETVHKLRSECLRQRNSLAARVSPVPLDELRSWSMKENGVLAHRTGRFFRVIGARGLSDQDNFLEQPLIEQYEVGILCLFVMQLNGEFYGLVNFKFEPGTPDGIEVAPTVQATRSNYETAHGGTRVPAAEIALSDDAYTIADAVHREQESWFLGKVNRNRIILLDAKEGVDIGRTLPDSSWVPIPVLLEAALESRLLNMDLRSILSMWPLEATTRQGSLPSVTSRSHPNQRELESVGSDPELVPLHGLTQWNIAESIEHRQRRFFSIVGFRVEGQGREIASWDQPLLTPVGMGQCTLLIRPGINGWDLLVSERVRIGSVRGPSIEARFQRGDIADHTTESRRRSMIAESSGLANCREIYSAIHAEEGGRFRGALVNYQLGLLTEAIEEQPTDRWVSLDEIEAMEQHGDRLSVELRTCLTMLKGLITIGILKL